MGMGLSKARDARYCGSLPTRAPTKQKLRNNTYRKSRRLHDLNDGEVQSKQTALIALRLRAHGLISLHYYLPNHWERRGERKNSLLDHRREIANDFTLD